MVMSAREFPKYIVIITLYILNLHHCLPGYDITTTHVSLSPTNASQNGATITILKDTTITPNNEWHVEATDDIGFHLHLSLNNIWSFHPSKITTLTLTIASDTGIATGSTGRDFIVSFSQSNYKFITTMIQLDNANSDDHFIYPKCDPTQPFSTPYGDGNIVSIVDANNGDRVNKALINKTNALFYQPPLTPPIKGLPMIFILKNHPLNNYMLFTYVNPGEIPRHCGYIAMDTNISMDIYLAAEDPTEYLDIKYINITHEYNATYSPTLSPTDNPTINPTKSPTNVPSVTPTESPSDNPTINPTKSPSNRPTKQISVTPSLPPTIAPVGSDTVAMSTTKNRISNSDGDGNDILEMIYMLLAVIGFLICVILICLVFACRKCSQKRNLGYATQGNDVHIDTTIIADDSIDKSVDGIIIPPATDNINVIGGEIATSYDDIEELYDVNNTELTKQGTSGYNDDSKSNGMHHRILPSNMTNISLNDSVAEAGHRNLDSNVTNITNTTSATIGFEVQTDEGGDVSVNIIELDQGDV